MKKDFSKMNRTDIQPAAESQFITQTAEEHAKAKTEGGNTTAPVSEHVPQYRPIVNMAKAGTRGTERRTVRKNFLLYPRIVLEVERIALAKGISFNHAVETALENWIEENSGK